MLAFLQEKLLHAGLEWTSYAHCFHRQEVAAHEVLLPAGKVSKRMYLIEKGCVRVWYNGDGRDITTQFFFENNMVGSIESFRKQTPSPVTIEALTAGVVWWIHKRDADRLLSELMQHPSLRDEVLNLLFERTFDYMKHAFSFITHTPEERYMRLLSERPEVARRVPQHYIASYLGITRVHLSRIRNKLARQR